MLCDEPYVRLLSLDFSRAFDTVRHFHLSEQLALLPIPDFLYNWIIALLHDRQHSTKFLGQVSAYCKINASIIQGSGLGPLNFLVSIKSLKPLFSNNRLLKYADDCYLLIPASAIHTTSSELDNVARWAATSNLKLNCSKSKEMIIRRPTSRPGSLPPPLQGITRVQEAAFLGVTLTDRLGFNRHIDSICVKANQSLYAIRCLIAHGLSGQRLHDVVRATTLARLLYASPVWWGSANVGQRARLSAFVRKLIRLNYLPDGFDSFDTLCDRADSTLFLAVLNNPSHTLHSLLPPVKSSIYSLRPRPHNREIPRADTLSRKNFILRMLYLGI